MSGQTDMPPTLLARPKYDGSGHYFTAEELLLVLDGVSVAAKWKKDATIVPEIEPEPEPEVDDEDDDENEEEAEITDVEDEPMPVTQEPVVDPETAEQKERPIQDWIESHREGKTNPAGTHSLRQWREDLQMLTKGRSRDAACVVLGVALLRQESRKALPEARDPTPPATIDIMWELIHEGLISGTLAMSPNRSPQGFLAVPLCSRVHNKNISELIRFHVWQAYDDRGDPGVAIHSHQPFARSWVLGGKGIDHGYSVRRTSNRAEAVATKYRLYWKKEDGGKAGREYPTYQRYSTIVELPKVLVKCEEKHEETHTKDMSYSIPSKGFHKTDVDPVAIHATLFYFDASYGFYKNARVLGPIGSRKSTQDRHPGGVTARYLAALADALRRFDSLMCDARQHSNQTNWASALDAIRRALELCSSPDGPLTKAQCYRDIVCAELGNIPELIRNGEHARTIEELLSKAVAGRSEKMETEGSSTTTVFDQVQTLQSVGSQRVEGTLGEGTYDLKTDIRGRADATDDLEEAVRVPGIQALGWELDFS